MSATASRPPSVLITLVILVLLGSMWTVLAMVQLYYTLTTFASAGQLIINLLFVSMVLAFSGSFLFGSWGLIRRKRYGRWIGVIGLSLVLLSILVGNIFRPTGQFKYYEYENSAQLLGGVVASLIFYGLVIFLIYRLARGARANAFFDPVVDPAPAQPPPPPTFADNDAE